MSNPTEGRCYHCHELAGQCEHCPSNETSEDHEPDWTTMQLCEGEAFGPGPMVVLDVNCKHCGRSGSVSATLRVEDLNW